MAVTASCRMAVFSVSISRHTYSWRWIEQNLKEFLRETLSQRCETEMEVHRYNNDPKHSDKENTEALWSVLEWSRSWSNWESLVWLKDYRTRLTANQHEEWQKVLMSQFCGHKAKEISTISVMDILCNLNILTSSCEAKKHRECQMGVLWIFWDNDGIKKKKINKSVVFVAFLIQKYSDVN